MKAPDKIFVGFLFDIDFAISHAGCERIREDDKEYISKDALLEWAKEHYTGLDITKRDLWDG